MPGPRVSHALCRYAPSVYGFFVLVGIVGRGRGKLCQPVGEVYVLKDIRRCGYDRLYNDPGPDGQVMNRLKVGGVGHGYGQAMLVLVYRQDDILASRFFRDKGYSLGVDGLASQLHHGKACVKGYEGCQVAGHDQPVTL